MPGIRRLLLARKPTQPEVSEPKDIGIHVGTINRPGTRASTIQELGSLSWKEGTCQTHLGDSRASGRMVLGGRGRNFDLRLRSGSLFGYWEVLLFWTVGRVVSLGGLRLGVKARGGVWM